jgi:predicted Zn-dependent peptidase
MSLPWASRFSWRAGLLLIGVLAALLVAPVAQAQSGTSLLDQFEEKVTTFTLDNGLDFVIIERHDAPVVSFNTFVDVGSINEPAGRTGLAHMFEHMAFKGTTSIGTTDIEKEMAALKRQEEIYLQLRREKAKGAQADSSRIAELEEQFQAAQEEAQSYIQEGEFENILERNGVTDLNAATSYDWTRYNYSLPANKVELFFALESDRFMNPVLREYYTERDVVMEERRRAESNPIGRLVEEMITTAFKAHPYGQPNIGYMSDLQNLSRSDAEAFFEKYYVANNMTIGIAGDVEPERMRELAEQYFGRLPSGEEPMPVTTEEPDQIGERRVVVREQSQPFVIIGYHRGSVFSEDDPVYTVLANILSQGRTSRMYQSLVETDDAVNVQSLASFPAQKDDHLFGVIAFPSRGVSPDSVEHGIYEVLRDVEENGVTQEELERAKTQARANLIQGLDSNLGLAQRLSQAEEMMGNWRTVFRQLDAIQAVTAEDVQRVAQETFQRSNRTVAMIKTESSGSGGTPTAAN